MEKRCLTGLQVCKLFEAGNLAAIHSKRVTIQPKDFNLVKRILEIYGVNDAFIDWKAAIKNNN